MTMSASGQPYDKKVAGAVLVLNNSRDGRPVCLKAILDYLRQHQDDGEAPIGVVEVRQLSRL